MYFTTSSGKIELQLTKAQAALGSHSGPCDADIAQLRTVPAIRRQLTKLKPEIVAAELAEYGAWEADELADHGQNLTRLLWIACGDIQENLNQGSI